MTGMTKAEKGLITSNPVRLSIALNYMLFTYYEMEEPTDAIKMAKRIPTIAEKKMKHLNEEQKEEANMILGIVREHQQLWKEEEEKKAKEEGQ